MTDWTWQQWLRDNPERVQYDTADPDAPARRQLRAEAGAPLEDDEALKLIRWVRAHEEQYPALRYFHHCEAGEYRPDATRIKLWKMGQRSGVPDYIWPYRQGEHVGLALELKRADKTNHATENQVRWLTWLERNGWRCHVAYGAVEAKAYIRDYTGWELR